MKRHTAFLPARLRGTLAKLRADNAWPVALAFAAILLGFSGAGLAATATWSGVGAAVNGYQSWETTANWSGTAPGNNGVNTLDIILNNTGVFTPQALAGNDKTVQSLTFDASSTSAILLRPASTTGNAKNLIFDSASSTPFIIIASGAGAHSIGGSSGTVNLLKNLTITHNGSNDFTISRPVTNTAGITKAGPGTLILAAANTYTGPTMVSGGKLVGVTSGSCSNSAVTVNNTAGCTLGVSVTDNSKPWACSNLTFAGVNAALSLDFGGVIPSGFVAPLQVNGNVTFSGIPTVTIIGTAISNSMATYPLMTWTGAANPANAPTLVILPPSLVGNLSLSGDGRTLNLNIISIPPVNLVYPASNSTSYQTIPYLKWADSVSSPYAGWYDIQISTNSSFVGIVDVDTVPAMINHYVPNQELGWGTNYWRVRYRDTNGVAGNWSGVWSFAIKAMPTVVNVPLDSSWTQIRSNLDYALAHSPAELRFQTGVYNLTADPADAALFYIQNSGSILINGQGCTFLISDRSGQTTPFFYGRNSSGPIQFKNFTVDYAGDSLAHVAGQVVGIEKFTYPDCAFTVQVDTATYPTLDGTLLTNTWDGLVLEAGTRQRWHALEANPRLGVNETWAQAKQGTNTYRFTPTANKSAFYDHLELGDWWVGSYRGGDLFYAYSDCPDLVINNVISKACRGRAVIPRSKCDRLRVVNNEFLCTGARALGMTSGGINDNSTEPWWEGNTLEYNADDMFNASISEQVVFRNNALRGPFRNAIFLQGNRQWVEGNIIIYAGLTGINLAPANLSTTNDVVNVGLIKNNLIIQPRLGGINMASDTSRLVDESGSPYHTDIRIEENVIQDVLKNEAISVSYGQRVELLNNHILTTCIPFSDVADPATAMGIYVTNSADVLIQGNEIGDTRLASNNWIVVDASSTTNVTLVNNTCPGINQAPWLGALSNVTVNVGNTVTFTNTAGDADAPSQALTYSLLAAPTYATLNATNGVFQWRPRVDQARSTNPIVIVLTDSGCPSLSATQSFVAVVNKLNSPQVTGLSLTNGQFRFTVAGDTGPDYLVQASTNLTSWDTLETKFSPGLPFLWTDSGTTNLSWRFYRILLGP